MNWGFVDIEQGGIMMIRTNDPHEISLAERAAYSIQSPLYIYLCEEDQYKMLFGEKEEDKDDELPHHLYLDGQWWMLWSDYRDE
jgi:hypothetical protein